MLSGKTQPKDFLTWKDYLLVVSVSAIFYLTFAYFIGLQKNWITPTAYYNYLFDAFRHGRLDLQSSSNYDLSYFHGKQYMNWGPSALLALAPILAWFGTKSSDVFYCCLFGLINVVLFLWVTDCASRWSGRSISPTIKKWSTLAFALSSPNFFLSIGGEIWFTSQIIATTYFLIGTGFLLRALHERGTKADIYIAMFALCLAWTTRTLLVFYILWPLALILIPSPLRTRDIIGKLTAIFIAFLGFTVWYNWVRFGDSLEFGMSYVIPKFYDDNSSLFDPQIANDNINFFFFQHFNFQLEPPYSNFSIVWASIPSMYPVSMLALALGLLQTGFHIRKWWKYALIFSLPIILESALILIKQGNGWTQVGSRYFAVPVTAMLLMMPLVIGKWTQWPFYLLTCYGIVANTYANYAFYFTKLGRP